MIIIYFELIFGNLKQTWQKISQLHILMHQNLFLSLYKQFEIKISNQMTFEDTAKLLHLMNNASECLNIMREDFTKAISYRHPIFRYFYQNLQKKSPLVLNQQNLSGQSSFCLNKKQNEIIHESQMKIIKIELQEQQNEQEQIKNILEIKNKESNEKQNIEQNNNIFEPKPKRNSRISNRSSQPISVGQRWNKSTKIDKNSFLPRTSIQKSRHSNYQREENYVNFLKPIKRFSPTSQDFDWGSQKDVDIIQNYTRQS